MGSYSYLTVRDLCLHSTKREVDPTVLVMFTEADRRITLPELPFSAEQDDEEGDEKSPGLQYVASLNVVKDRLEFMGFTLSRVRRAFEEGLIERLKELDERKSDPFWSGSAYPADLKAKFERSLERERALLSGLTFDDWLEAFSFVVRNRLQPDPHYHEPDAGEHEGLPPVVRYILSKFGDECYGFPAYDFRTFMRAAVEITGTNAELVYDLSELVEGENVSLDEDLCGWARRETTEEFVLNHKVVVLTEGKSDARAIEGALGVLYPHLVEYYSFMDFQGARASGGAGVLVATVKAFIGAGIVNRIVALFDNDTAAAAALRQLRDIQLPPNVRVLRYPSVAWASSYPTIGPQGVVEMDVNGLAGSLELYFGLDVLVDSGGTRTPIQWRGYDDVLQQYQGEVLDKGQLQQRFFDKLRRCEEDRDLIRGYDWSGMRAIVDALRTAFHESN